LCERKKEGKSEGLTALSMYQISEKQKSDLAGKTDLKVPREKRGREARKRGGRPS